MKQKDHITQTKETQREKHLQEMLAYYKDTNQL